MRKHRSAPLTILFILSMIFFSSVSKVMAFTQPSTWTGVCVAEDLPNGDDVATLQGFQCLIANVFSVIFTVIGLAGFVMFVIGSLRWMLSGNDSKGVETAKNTMTFSIIGIVVALSGFIILNLIKSFTGIDVTNFIIPDSQTGF
jgi:hypothetical protein